MAIGIVFWIGTGCGGDPTFHTPEEFLMEMGFQGSLGQLADGKILDTISRFGLRCSRGQCLQPGEFACGDVACGNATGCLYDFECDAGVRCEEGHCLDAPGECSNGMCGTPIEDGECAWDADCRAAQETLRPWERLTP